MTTPTDAAIAALLKQMQTLTETVDAQAKRLDDLHEFNTKILDEKKDMKRALEARSVSKMTPEQIADLESMGFEKADDGNWYPKGVKGAHEITRADARDPQKYRAAKLAAERSGKTLSIVDEAGDRDPVWRNTQSAAERGEIAQTATITLDDSHHKVRYVRADHQTGGGIVQRRLDAEREGYRIVTWRQPADLPSHMQMKLALMEKAHGGEA